MHFIFSSTLANFVRTMATVAIVFTLVGCSGDSDSGIESYSGRYSIAVNQIDANTGAILPTTVPGTMTILSSGTVDATYTSNSIVILLTGSVTAGGVVTMRSADGAFPPTLTGTITGSGGAKKITAGTVVFQNLPDVKTTWSAQCISDCG
ncbi:hypothetical protein ACYVVD_06245 [Arenicellales bacterium IMCC58067]